MITIYNQPSTDQSASNQNREQIFKPDQSFSASYLVRNQDGELFWYLPDLDGFVAFTDCPIYQALAGKETTYFYNSDGPWGANTP